MPSLVAALSIALSPGHVTLVFSPEYHVEPAVERYAVAEAAAIWAPYGVMVTSGKTSCTSRHRDLQLAVVMSASAGGSALQMPLGAVDFDDAGTPFSVVTVFIDRLARLLEETRLWDVPEQHWPPAFRERVVGRAIGRVLAHEIGHVLLGSKQHAPRGLMRAVQRADELVDPARNRYRLAR